MENGMKNRVIIAGVLMAACALTTVAGERRISVNTSDFEKLLLVSVLFE